MTAVKPLIAVSLTDKNFKNQLQKIPEFLDEVDILEIRADLSSDFQIQDLNLIPRQYFSKILFTCRQKNHGGAFIGSESQWREIIEEAIKMGFAFIDIEFGPNKIINLEKKHNDTKIILSYHHFEYTPGYRNLKALQKRMRGFNPYATKFATMVKTDKDIINLTRLLTSRKKEEKMIVLGMGQKSRNLRIFNYYLGNIINYVAISKNEAAAPGQITLQYFKNYLNILN